MTKTLDLAAVFKNDAAELVAARARAFVSHPTDIRAAGNEIEVVVRDYLRRVLPAKYHVTHGHLVDRQLQVSPQLDVIIADGHFLPSLLRMKDGTEYVPAEGTYAVGEIKSTFSRSGGHLEEFVRKLSLIDSDLIRPEIRNTAYQGVTGDTLMRDMAHSSMTAIHNRLFSFMLCIDAGDFTLAGAREAVTSAIRRHTPGIVALLNRGALTSARVTDRFEYSAYPAESPEGAKLLLIAPESGATGSREGAVLGFLYAMLMGHLNRSFVEPVPARPYLQSLLQIKREAIEGIGD
jgi:hypothetical protein